MVFETLKKRLAPLRASWHEWLDYLSFSRIQLACSLLTPECLQVVLFDTFVKPVAVPDELMAYVLVSRKAARSR